MPCMRRQKLKREVIRKLDNILILFNQCIFFQRYRSITVIISQLKLAAEVSSHQAWGNGWMLLDLAWGRGMWSWDCYRKLLRKRATGFGWKEMMERGRRASVVIDYSKHQATNGVGWLLQDQEQEVLWSTALAPPLDWWRKATQESIITFGYEESCRNVFIRVVSWRAVCRLSCKPSC